MTDAAEAPPPDQPDETPDPRYELVLNQMSRGLTQQQSVLDNLRARAGTMVATASLVSSFFGAQALTGQHDSAVAFWVVLAIVFLIVVVIAAILIVWPYEWRWGIDGHKLLVDYVEASEPATLDEMRRSLAYYIQDDLTSNELRFTKLWRHLRVAILAVTAEVVCWVLALLTR